VASTFCKCDISAGAAICDLNILIYLFRFVFFFFFFDIFEKLSISAPAAEVKLKVLNDIAKEYNLEWNSSNTEAEFSKKHEDLLVLIPICASVSLHIWLGITLSFDASNRFLTRYLDVIVL
jgi:hypothetical protein